MKRKVRRENEGKEEEEGRTEEEHNYKWELIRRDKSKEG